MPSNYIFKCTNCQKTQKRYRNVKKCTACGGLLQRVEYLEEGQLIHRHGYKMNRDGHFDVVREEDLAELESTLTTAQEENKRYKLALEFYANESNYCSFTDKTSKMFDDFGERAQSALNGGK